MEYQIGEIVQANVHGQGDVLLVIVDESEAVQIVSKENLSQELIDGLYSSMRWSRKIWNNPLYKNDENQLDEDYTILLNWMYIFEDWEITKKITSLPELDIEWVQMQIEESLRQGIAKIVQLQDMSEAKAELRADIAIEKYHQRVVKVEEFESSHTEYTLANGNVIFQFENTYINIDKEDLDKIDGEIFWQMRSRRHVEGEEVSTLEYPTSGWIGINPNTGEVEFDCIF